MKLHLLILCKLAASLLDQKSLLASEELENEESDLAEDEQKQLQSNMLRLAKRESA